MVYPGGSYLAPGHFSEGKSTSWVTAGILGRAAQSPHRFLARHPIKHLVTIPTDTHTFFQGGTDAFTPCKQAAPPPCPTPSYKTCCLKVRGKTPK